MIRISTVIAVPGLIIASSSGLAQTKETPQARAAYAKVVAVRDSMERGHGHFVTVNGIRMHYLAWGDAKGVPLVWAHGSGSDGYELRHVAPRLAEAGYRVLAVDYRGHGQTRVKDVNFGMKIVGDMSAEELQKRERSGWTFDMLRRIGRNMKGEWAFLPDFEALMGKLGMAATTMKPTMVPPLQWSENAMIPRMMFRNLHVPMMIIDPQSERDARPVTDQNLWLVEDHPKLVIHRVYPETGHNVLNDRPDSLVRDAIELLDRVRKRSRQ
jgi:pimeloyl-ACP methyl ester carboxylesterase